MEEKSYSFYLDQAKEVLDSIRGSPQDMDDRLQKSIELAELLILHAKQNQTTLEKKKTGNISKIVNFLRGKALLSNVIDQAFRAKSLPRIIDQISYLLLYGIPAAFPLSIKIKLFLFKLIGPAFPSFFATLMRKAIIKECLNALNFADSLYLHKYLQAKKNNEVTFWLIQKPAFGKKIVDEHLRNILKLINKPEIPSLCINISSLSSNLRSPFYEKGKEELEKNLKKIFHAVLKNSQKVKKEKLLILNFEDHHHLNLIIEVFENVVMLDEFLPLKVGITLKAYFPESYEMQKRLTEFAKRRIEKNGNNIIIRITKGFNLNLEHIKAAKNNWPSPTFISKNETDANFKKMISYGLQQENVEAANIGIATTNIFDIAYSLITIKEYNIGEHVYFEIPEGRSTRTIKNGLSMLLNKNLKLFCPIIYQKDFHLVSNFLLRSINDLSNPENFISQLDLLFPGTKTWDDQLDNFKQSIEKMTELKNEPKQKQNRKLIIKRHSFIDLENEPTTNFALEDNKNWAAQIIINAKKYIPQNVPLVINSREIKDELDGLGFNPSNPINHSYRYALANELQIGRAIKTAKNSEKKWQSVSLEDRHEILMKVAQKLRENRAFLIQNLMVDIGKSLSESDSEVSDAIDVIEYQTNQLRNIISKRDVRWEPKGTFLVIPSWGYPLSVSAEALTSALISGNVVIFKPLKHCVLICYQLAKLMWEAGIPKHCLQFLNCTNELFNNKLIADTRINSVIISTSSEKAKRIIKLRKGQDVIATTGGINTIIVTTLSDREDAIKNIIDSAFNFSGQKFSSASVLILEKEVYEDIDFQNNLKEAAQNLTTGNVFDPQVTITPLIEDPQEDLKKALTVLDENEWWLVKPKKDEKNPWLYSCGIKYGVTTKSFTKNTELYGPILSVMKTNDLIHAIKLANKSKYGLVGGLQSLDHREHVKWLNTMHAGNYYINTKITDAKIKRQPFGGYKESSFGMGYKSGGPNFNLHFIKPEQKTLPKEKLPVNDWVNSLTAFLEKIDLSAEQLGTWYASVANYSYWWKRLKQDVDAYKVYGQDNFIRYTPRKNITLRLTEDSFAFDALRVCAAALTCSTPLEISWTNNQYMEEFNWIDLIPILSNIEESNEEFLSRVKEGKIKRLRLISPPSEKLKVAASLSACCIIDQPVLANGRFELLHYIKEISITYDYHRYGNLGIRESEIRRPIL